MPAITSGLYKVIVHQDVGISEKLNVYWYRHTSGLNEVSQQLWDAFDADVLPLCAPVQNTTINYDLLEVVPIFGTDVGVLDAPTTLAGTLSGSDNVVNFTVSSIRLLRTTNETRSGWKRYSGLVEGSVVGGSVVASYLSDLETLAAALDTAITADSETFQPVLVRKPGTYSTGEQTGWLYNPIQSAVALARVSTQNTRKSF